MPARGRMSDGVSIRPLDVGPSSHRVHWPKWEGEIEIRRMYEEEDPGHSWPGAFDDSRWSLLVET
jgi:hypothetical protein